MSDDEEEYEYDYGSDGEYNSEHEECEEGVGEGGDLIEIENSFYGKLKNFAK
jgi:hypothetical protein